MRVSAAFLFLLLTHAASAAEGGGVSFDLGIGSGGASIKNPDGTKANYKILAASGQVLLPLAESKSFGVALTAGMRYLDLTNTANGENLSEVANMIGPGAGLQLRGYKFFAGYRYNMMLARHYTIGTISQAINYKMPLTTLDAGITMPFNQLSVSISYSQSTGKVPASGSGLSQNTPYNDQAYWIQFTYSTGAPFSKFLKYLF